MWKCSNTYRKCWFADVILFGVTVCSKFYIKCVIIIIIIPAFAFQAEAGTHLPNPEGWKAELALGGWLVTYWNRQNSCDKFYKVRWTTKLSCDVKLFEEFWCQKLLNSDTYSSTVLRFWPARDWSKPPSVNRHISEGGDWMTMSDCLLFIVVV